LISFWSPPAGAGAGLTGSFAVGCAPDDEVESLFPESSLPQPAATSATTATGTANHFVKSLLI
jgi:hypothetical protein